MTTESLIDINLIREWVSEAGQIALNQSAQLVVDIKSDHTPITQIDRQIESFLLERISRHYPNHGVLAEEGSSRPGSDFTWIIDPIDGTRAFASGLPVWGISVGVFYQGYPYAGVFYMPATREMHWGNNTQAFCNDRELFPKYALDIDSPLAFIAVPSNAHRHYEISFNRLRSLGSTTAHLAYVARHIAVAALTRQIYLWDIASVLPILNATGVGLIYLSGKPLELSALMDGSLSPEPVVAASIDIIEDVRALIHQKTDVTENGLIKK